jgi:hypothetical protein
MPVFQLSPTGTLTALPPIPTGPGARSAALEPMSGRLYLVTAEPTAAADKPARFSPGTATLLAIDAPR